MSLESLKEIKDLPVPCLVVVLTCSLPIHSTRAHGMIVCKYSANSRNTKLANQSPNKVRPVTAVHSKFALEGGF